jgi:hypothetical protein
VFTGIEVSVEFDASRFTGHALRSPGQRSALIGQHDAARTQIIVALGVGVGLNRREKRRAG